MLVYTISIFCSRYTHNLGSTWELGSGFATSFYLFGSPVKNQLKVKIHFIQPLNFIVISFYKIPAKYPLVRAYICTPLQRLIVAKIVDNGMRVCVFN